MFEQEDSLEQRLLPLGTGPHRAVACTAVAVDEAGTIVVADAAGGLWELQVRAKPMSMFSHMRLRHCLRSSFASRSTHAVRCVRAA